MHNTSTEYKQMHNKTISWNDNWILIFICFVGRLLLLASSSYSFITSSFLIQMLNIDKRLFKNWVLHIPHRLRDLLWIVSAWFSVAPIFSSLMSRFSSCVRIYPHLPLELEPLHLCRCPIHFLQEPVKSYASMLEIFSAVWGVCPSSGSC